jgi:hypothetical protein
LLTDSFDKIFTLSNAIKRAMVFEAYFWSNCSFVTSFGGNDSREGAAPPVTVTVQLCNCSGNDHGTCDWTRLQNGSSASDTFQIVACNCVLYAYQGVQNNY